MNKTITILNLNLWNYNKFEERKEKIIQFIQKHDPDIIVFEEVRDDQRYNKKGNNQAKQINETLKYSHLAFAKGQDVNKVNKTPQNQPCIEGVAVLSKFPILEKNIKKLKQEKDDKFNRATLHVKLKAQRIIHLFAVHFSPNDKHSELHLQETLEYARNKKIKPIIVGDFNIRTQKYLLRNIKGTYTSSWEYKKFITYPPAHYTLDYMLIPKKYSFEKIRCLGTDISDHKALLASIKLD